MNAFFIKCVFSPQRGGKGGRWEGDSGRRGHMYTLANSGQCIWQKSTQYCKAIIIQLKANSFFLMCISNQTPNKFI